MAIDCRINKKLKIYGFGIPGQGFYAIDIPEAKLKVSQATSFLTVIEGEATEDKIAKELKNLVKGD
jgi:predicted 3-demethylubiquinone-9 3-methyltransferase (glyoxalase superfamily)